LRERNYRTARGFMLAQRAALFFSFFRAPKLYCRFVGPGKAAPEVTLRDGSAMLFRYDAIFPP